MSVLLLGVGCVTIEQLPIAENCRQYMTNMVQNVRI